jgi:NADH-quinone oxidoreductase subunit J
MGQEEGRGRRGGALILPENHPMAEFPFYLFAFLTVLAAAGVVVNRNAVNAAVCLLLSFIGVAGLFVLLGAYFLAALQVLVYAGAVAVLFLFIIMLLDVKGGDPRKPYKKIAAVSGLFVLALLITGVLSLAKRGELANAAAAAGPAVGGDLKEYGILLFTKYLLPVEMTGFLLLIAMLGVAVLSRKQEEEAEAGSENPGDRSQDSAVRGRNPEAGSQETGAKV